MKASSLHLFERAPEYTKELIDYIKANAFLVAEVYKNITKSINPTSQNKPGTIQEAYNRVYGSRATPFELLTALELIHSKITHQKLSLKEVFKEFGIEQIETLHPKIARTQSETHQRITKAAPDISEELVKAINRSN